MVISNDASVFIYSLEDLKEGFNRLSLNTYIFFVLFSLLTVPFLRRFSQTIIACFILLQTFNVYGYYQHQSWLRSFVLNKQLPKNEQDFDFQKEKLMTFDKLNEKAKKIKELVGGYSLYYFSNPYLSLIKDKIKFFNSDQQQLPLPYQILAAHANHLKIAVTAPNDAWLLYEDPYHPFWKADINGQKTVIVKSTDNYKMLKLKPGLNNIHFYFKSNTIALIHGFIGLNSLAYDHEPILGQIGEK